MGRKGNKDKRPLFSARERRGVLLLIPLVGVLGWIIYSASRPRIEASTEVIGNGIAESTSNSTAQTYGEPVFDRSQFNPEPFDPNTVTYEQLRGMGVASNSAAALVRARERGKVYQIPEDFATVYGITDSLYALLKPFITIDKQYRAKPYANQYAAGPADRQAAEAEVRKPAREITLSPFDPNAYSAGDFAALGFSPKQAAVIVNFRESMGGFRTPEDLARCYVVSDEMFDRIKDFLIFPVGLADVPAKVAVEPRTGLVDINTADSVTLVSVRGIGPRTAQDIIAYRVRLGGFHDIAQLADLKVITERNYELMCPEIWADSCEIQKIDINFASPKALATHPYITGARLRKILKNRQLKGGWRTIEDMIEDNTLTPAEAARLSPYLQFGPPQS